MPSRFASVAASGLCRDEASEQGGSGIEKNRQLPPVAGWSPASYVLSPYKTVSEQARRCIRAEVCLWAATCSGPCWFAKRDFTLREPIDEFVDPSEMPALRKMVGEMHDALGSYTKVVAACCVQVGASNLKRIHTGKTRRTHRSIAEVIELAYEEVFECGGGS